MAGDGEGFGSVIWSAHPSEAGFVGALCIRAEGFIKPRPSIRVQDSLAPTPMCGKDMSGEAAGIGGSRTVNFLAPRAERSNPLVGATVCAETHEKRFVTAELSERHGVPLAKLVWCVCPREKQWAGSRAQLDTEYCNPTAVHSPVQVHDVRRSYHRIASGLSDAHLSIGPRFGLADLLNPLSCRVNRAVAAGVRGEKPDFRIHLCFELQTRNAASAGTCRARSSSRVIAATHAETN